MSVKHVNFCIIIAFISFLKNEKFSRVEKLESKNFNFVTFVFSFYKLHFSKHFDTYVITKDTTELMNKESCTSNLRTNKKNLIIQRHKNQTNSPSRKSQELNAEEVIDFQIAGTNKIQKSFGTLRKRPE